MKNRKVHGRGEDSSTAKFASPFSSSLSASCQSHYLQNSNNVLPMLPFEETAEIHHPTIITTSATTTSGTRPRPESAQSSRLLQPSSARRSSMAPTALRARRATLQAHAQEEKLWRICLQQTMMGASAVAGACSTHLL